MRKLTTEQFINQANIKHGFRYGYDNTIYTGIKNHVIITCPTHGNFKQRADCHRHGKGCQKCADQSRITSQQITLEEFLAKATKSHGDKFNYDKVNYINCKTLVTIVCSIHGEFKQLPLNHVYGYGCEQCGRESVGKSNRLDSHTFIERCSEIHNNKYIYDRVDYTTSNSKILIGCPDHGYFEQLAGNHISGKGCLKCGRNNNLSEDAVETYINSHLRFLGSYSKNISTPLLLENAESKFASQHFDYWFDENLVAIEYQGGQHYRPIEMFGGQLGYERQQYLDNRKRKLCRDNNIILVEIPFNKFDKDTKVDAASFYFSKLAEEIKTTIELRKL